MSFLQGSQASRWDAGAFCDEPGDKSPGYFRSFLRNDSRRGGAFSGGPDYFIVRVRGAHRKLIPTARGVTNQVWTLEKVIASLDKVKARLKKLSLVFVFLLVCYVGSYIYLSEYGRYEPVRGASHIECYLWTPKGFITESKGNQPNRKKNLTLFFTYLPLFLADVNFWHQAIQPGEKTKYPVGEANDRFDVNSN